MNYSIKICAALCFGFCFILGAHAQLPLGFTVAGNQSYDGDITAMKSDSHGNVYVTGYYVDSLVWQGTTYLSHDTAGSPYYEPLRDIFLFKVSPNGTTEWFKTIGGPGDDLATSLVIDGAGDIIIAGVVTGNVNFDNTTVSSNGALWFAAKYNTSGNLVWLTHGDSTRASYDNNNSRLSYDPYSLNGAFTGSFGYQIINDLACDSLGNIYIAGTAQGGVVGQTTIQEIGGNHMLTGKIAPNGDLIWAKVIGITDAIETANRMLSVDLMADGNVIFGGSSHGGMNDDGACGGYTDIGRGKYFTKITDPAGNCISQTTEELWHENSYSNGHFKLRAAASGSLYSLAYEDYNDNTGGLLLLRKIYPDGSTAWEQIPTWPNACSCFNLLQNGLYLDKFENTYMAYPLPNQVSGTYDTYIVKYDSSFQPLWTQRVDSTHITSITVDNKGIIYMGGTRNGRLFFGKALDMVYGGGGVISGFVYADANNNCTKDSNDLLSPINMVKVTPGGFYTSVRSDGSYSLPVDTGVYTLAPVISPGGRFLIKDSCAAFLTADIGSYNTVSSNNNFGYQITDCSYLTLHINGAVLRPCRINDVSVTYENSGLQAANNVQIKIKLPPFVSLNSATINYTIATDSSVIFNIGAIPAEASGMISLQLGVDCNTPLGLWECFQGAISPANICADTAGASPFWDRSYLNVSSLCDHGTPIFTVHNTGSAMADSTRYEVYINSALYTTGNVKLSGGDSLSIPIPETAFFYEMYVWQATGCPFDSIASESIAGCGDKTLVITDPNIPVQLPAQNNNESYTTTYMQVLVSHDPNEKLVVPTGVTDNHYVPSKTSLTYTVEFQNTGNDTAFKVIVIDTLAPYLDMESFQFLNSSNTCRVNFSGNRVVIFEFDTIALPDSLVNPIGSTGYLRFSVNLKPDVPQGTEVSNQADIYFDFNSAIRTNPASVTVKDTVIRYVAAPVSAANSITQAAITIYPNPFTNSLTVQLPEGVSSATFIMTDMMGQPVLNTRLNKPYNAIPVTQLSGGVYLYYFISGEKINSGKLVKF